ncbi:MAG: ACT domain-containing protein [candidate division WOR-3 bacterium]|nr:ACT domain-containing protein [candidate division WOR-3 bacterium]
MEIRGNKNIARVTVHGVPDKPGEAGKLFDTLGEHNINIELISYIPGEGRTMNISFAVVVNDLENVVNILKKLYPYRISFDKEVAMLSLYYDGLGKIPGIAGKIFSMLGDNDINIELISTSINSITVGIKEKHLEKATESLKQIL